MVLISVSAEEKQFGRKRLIIAAGGCPGWPQSIMDPSCFEMVKWSKGPTAVVGFASDQGM